VGVAVVATRGRGRGMRVMRGGVVVIEDDRVSGG